MNPSGRHRIIELDETVSTNADAMRLALQGEPLPLWVSARRQTGGRGRAGRGWQSDDCNLQASLAFLCAGPLIVAQELALLAGVAAIDAIRGIKPLASDVGLRLKWPNDILIGNAKTGGILVESTTARGEPGFLAVIGIGLNVATCPSGLGRAATSLAQNGLVTTPRAMLDEVADQMERWLAVWDAGRGFSHVREAWLSRAGTIGEAISVHTSSGRRTGTYRGLSPSGALLADCDGCLETITAGDVNLAANDNRGGRPGTV